MVLGERVLSLADNLSRSLQKKHLSAAEGQAMAALTIQSSKALRTDHEFGFFWRELMTWQMVAGVDEPSLPRRCKVPSHLEVGESSGHFPSTLEDHYQPIYFATLDTIVYCISSWFDQTGYQIYCQLEALLLKGVAGKNYDSELSCIMGVYSEDLLKTQLLLLNVHFQEESRASSSATTTTASGNSSSNDTTSPTLMDIAKYLKSLEQSSQTLLSEVVKLVCLIMVAPATNASSERSFSALLRVKTYLRAMMTQERLNHVLLLHVHWMLVTDSI